MGEQEIPRVDVEHKHPSSTFSKRADERQARKLIKFVKFLAGSQSRHQKFSLKIKIHYENFSPAWKLNVNLRATHFHVCARICIKHISISKWMANLYGNCFRGKGSPQPQKGRFIKDDVGRHEWEGVKELDRWAIIEFGFHVHVKAIKHKWKLQIN